MVEQLVVQYLNDNTSLTYGTDLFLGSLPPEQRSGVMVQMVTQQSGEGMERAQMLALLAYEDYVQARTVQSEILTALRTARGTSDGSWTPADDIYLEDMGIDALGRHILAVNFTVMWEE